MNNTPNFRTRFFLKKKLPKWGKYARKLLLSSLFKPNFTDIVINIPVSFVEKKNESLPFH